MAQPVTGPASAVTGSSRGTATDVRALAPQPEALDDDAAFRAVHSRDPRFDGRLFVGVLSTGIYCRPSCPSRTPLRRNCAFFLSAAACVDAGFRACRRCRPDALPGSRGWDVDADLAGRALRLVHAGAVDEAGVAGLAQRLAVSPRHLHRVLVAQVGASPVALAQARRAEVARQLLEQVDWAMADVAFAAGFSSIRQFNAVMRAHFGATPSSLRTTRAHGPTPDPTTLVLRLRHWRPLDGGAWLDHVARRMVPGLEAVQDDGVRKVLRAASGPALVRLGVQDGEVTAQLTLTALRDLTRVVGRLRHWADLDADPSQVDAVLGRDPLLAPLVAMRPGLRVPGITDPVEAVVRTVLGQQVSVQAARTMTARLVAALGAPTPWGLRQFPDAAALLVAGVDGLGALGVTRARAQAVVAVAGLIDSGLDLGPGGDREEAREALLAVPGVGPWTVEYLALRSLGDPDAFPAHDLVLRQSLGGVSAAEALRRAEAWRPWRGYAAQHLWTAAAARVSDVPVPDRSGPSPFADRSHPPLVPVEET